ncbi:hypothetical protein NE237_024646 [Protea cynaroides]|uniref:Acyl-coenzyme A thioesterase 13 n=1 Tax=Protea cynaroides TaxID=273540 RepID=A0A9Q0H3R3_9MAGN|nr:hypothetical protein NE237_024646 [Protea cynaroides]
MVNEEEIIVEEAKQWLEGRGQEDSTSHDIEFLPLCGIKVLEAKMGWLLCNLKVHPHLADRNGNCHAGAIATIIDVVGAAVISTYGGNIKVSVDFNISYFSTVKIQEELEIEGKVVANREKVSLNVVEVRRKEDGMLLALGKQWMAQINAGQTVRTRL